MSYNTQLLDSYDDCTDVLRAFQRESGTKFSVWKVTRNFGDHEIANAKQVVWKDRSAVVHGRQDYTGIPFAILGQRKLDCRFGKDRQVKFKIDRKVAKEREKQDGEMGDREYSLKTKKIGCRAMIAIREIVTFPSYQIIGEPGDTQKRDIAKEIMDKIRSGQEVDYKPLYVLTLPDSNCHTGHPVKEVRVISAQANYVLGDEEVETTYVDGDRFEVDAAIQAAVDATEPTGLQSSTTRTPVTISKHIIPGNSVSGQKRKYPQFSDGPPDHTAALVEIAREKLALKKEMLNVQRQKLAVMRQQATTLTAIKSSLKDIANKNKPIEIDSPMKSLLAQIANS